jgi:hypothetical protein
MSEIRTYIGKTGSQGRKSVTHQVEELDDGRIRIDTWQDVTRCTSDLMSVSEWLDLKARVDALSNTPPPDPDPDPPPPPPTPGAIWAWDASKGVVEGTFPTKNVVRPNFVMTDWAVATAVAKAGDPEYDVPRSQEGGVLKVRIPLGTKPDPSGDGHLSVHDPEKGLRYEMWQAVYDSTTRKIKGCSAGQSFPQDAVNITQGWRGSNAAGTPSWRGLVTPEQMKAAIDAKGDLGMTLQFGTPNIGGVACPPGTPRYPGSHNAPTGDHSSPMEGTWIRLDPAVDVEALAIPEWQKVLARTLQRRGAINRDNAGAWGIYGENPINRPGVSWSLAGLSGGQAALSTAFPFAKLQILAPPPK